MIVNPRGESVWGSTLIRGRFICGPRYRFTTCGFAAGGRGCRKLLTFTNNDVDLLLHVLRILLCSTLLRHPSQQIHPTPVRKLGEDQLLRYAIRTRNLNLNPNPEGANRCNDSDVEKARDKVPHKRLISKLGSYGF